MDRPTLYGFDGSTYVRTVRMALAAKGVAYEQVPVNVLAGEPKSAEHRARHPFGKVPVLDIDGLRLYETGAILRYVDAAREGPALQPESAKDRARQDMAYGVVDSYGYAALIGGVAAFHLFPEFVGGRSEDARREGLETGSVVLREAMKLKGADPFIAGPRPSLADLLLAPIMDYVGMTEDRDRLFIEQGVEDWWAHVSALDVFRDTAPDL